MYKTLMYKLMFKTCHIITVVFIIIYIIRILVILQKIYLELHGLVYSVCLTEEILTFLTTSGAKWFFHEVIFQPYATLLVPHQYLVLVLYPVMYYFPLSIKPHCALFVYILIQPREGAKMRSTSSNARI